MEIRLQPHAINTTNKMENKLRSQKFILLNFKYKIKPTRSFSDTSKEIITIKGRWR